MSKLSRVTQLLFGSSSGSNQIAQFGSYANSTPTFTTNVATIQALGQWLTGWFGAVVGGNSPAIEDMNAMCYVIFYQLCYILQEGVAEYDSGTTYFKGSIVNDGNGALYISQQDNNSGNALTNATYWLSPNGQGVSTVTTNTVITTATSFIRSNSTSGSLTHTLPQISSTPVGYTVKIKDVGTGGNTTGVQAHAGDDIDGNNAWADGPLTQYASASFFCNGTTWDVI